MEAAVCRLSSKQVILTIWQYSKENTYVTVSFNKAVLRQKKVFLFPEIGQVKKKKMQKETKKEKRIYPENRLKK